MPTREQVLKAAVTFEPQHHIGLAKVYNDGLVGMSFDGDFAMWTRVRARKMHDCVLTGLRIEKGEHAFAPVGNQMYRMRRICDEAMQLVIEAHRRKDKEMGEDKLGDNMEPLDSPGDAQFEVGDYVEMNDDAEMYAGERVKIIARGKGSGPFYAGTVVYDIVGEDAEGEDEGDNAWRVRESDIAGVA